MNKIEYYSICSTLLLEANAQIIIIVIEPLNYGGRNIYGYYTISQLWYRYSKGYLVYRIHSLEEK